MDGGEVKQGDCAASLDPLSLLFAVFYMHLFTSRSAVLLSIAGEQFESREVIVIFKAGLMKEIVAIEVPCNLFMNSYLIQSMSDTFSTMKRLACNVFSRISGNTG